ncbi:hypothetical protein Fleli_2224 [Bernardetia litoralis DSM 6794]|uniref:Uncharacterized protein n=1 Tax=Bernardetia litoralis (strain ATCC 23117 / DSM 6794 / NBRC 15988 / NCIMB 1366 / Fx l1 / Sio-4) TaxID=880071 RepID=I4AKW7_BERLS|nr:hypothetical protein [Bernardetia litoralis]AFM04602.1 hypothetical protein Fleli_2224 [Bernardetia litoralis DSM 6794]
MNKAKQGNNEEVKFTKLLNQKGELWNDLGYDTTNYYAIHVISNKFGEINQAKIPPKADIFIGKGSVDDDYLQTQDYYLSENDAVKFGLEPVAKSGISVKIAKSNYTIIKISASTFQKIFGSNILGVGASIYSSKEFEKNPSVLLGWGISFEEFQLYFSGLLKIDKSEITLDNKKILGKIKTISNETIKKQVLESAEMRDLVFKGIGNFEEPFTAHWIIENNQIKENYYIPFSVTTGSGRSKGIFTVVLKPR